MEEETFWRVTDASTIAAYCPVEGFRAGDTFSRVTLDPVTEYEAERLEEQILDHLDWRNRRPTPFISVYSDYGTAVNEAWRRMKEGKQRAKLWEIHVDEDDDDDYVVEWETVDDLSELVGFWIPEYAYHNAEYEALFAHRIPRDCVVGYEMFTNDRGEPDESGWIPIRNKYFDRY